MLPHPKKFINQAHLENGRYGQTVTHLEKELELKHLQAPEELKISSVSHNTANTNADRPEPTCHRCKETRNYTSQCSLLKRQKEQTEDTQTIPGNKNSGANNSIPYNNTNRNNNNNYKKINRAVRKPKTVYPPCETCGKTNHSTEKCYHGTNAANRPPPWHKRPERQNQVQEKANQNDSKEAAQAAAQNLN